MTAREMSQEVLRQLDDHIRYLRALPIDLDRERVQIALERAKLAGAVTALQNLRESMFGAQLADDEASETTLRADEAARLSSSLK